MKNLPIRKKMIALYLTMSFFTILSYVVSYNFMGRFAEEGANLEALRRFVIIFYIVYTIIYVGFTLFVGRVLASQIALPAQQLFNVAHELSKGNLDVKIDYESNDELGNLAKELKQMISGMKEQADIIATIAEGNFTKDVHIRSEKDIVNHAISIMLEKNNRMISEIRTASSQVADGAQQISNSAQSLALGSSNQATSIGEIYNNLQNITKKSEENATAARDAFSLTKETGEKIEHSLQSMNHLRQAMLGIDNSSKNIRRIIKVIDDIAFQTNILALNAAVEAARAGQYGKGFAVVAEEVRSLAAKSADAARETTSMIEDSANRVEEGNKLVEITNQDLIAVGEFSGNNLSYIERINSASKDQSDAIKELNLRITEISDVVRVNTATAQESASSAEEMSAQSVMLTNIVSRFKLKSEKSLYSSAGDSSLPSHPDNKAEKSSSNKVPSLQGGYEGLGKY